MKNAQVSEQYIRAAIPHLVGDQARELTRVVNQLVATFHPERVYLFGSQARGTPRPDSDIDILVVVPTADQPTYRLAALAPLGLPVELLFMTRREFEERALAAASLPARVLSEGRLPYAA
jgi:predicted nucleotidyltransferase